MNVANEDQRSKYLPADFSGAEEIVESIVPLPNLTHTAKQYASMMQTTIPISPVYCGLERRESASKLVDNYFWGGYPRWRLWQFQRINIDE